MQVFFNITKGKKEIYDYHLRNGQAIKMAQNVFFLESGFLRTVNFRIKIAFWWKNLEALNANWVNS
jgi:hypothetical protein